MNPERIKRLLQQKENIHLEFKEAATTLPGNLFESICAMLNRDGGDILLGVEENAVSKMVTDLVNLSNNPQKLDPPFILFPQVYSINNRKIIHIQVPASSQVHKTGKIIYDRSNDGDFKVEQPHRIAEIANRKRNHYTEGIIYPALRMEDFKQELFPKIRNLIRSNNPAHPWLALNDRQMMEISGLWKKDYLSGQEGFTLAAALLLGKDEVIQQIIPHYKIDALVRINNTDRYDDRLYIQTNVIVETENANNPHGEGPIDPMNFVPFPKNPAIAKFFIQLGRVEELGSGILTTTRLIKEYAGRGKAVFIEGGTFKTSIPLPGRAKIINDTVNDTINDTAKDRLIEVIKLVLEKPGMKINDLIEKLNVSERTAKRDLEKIRGLVEYRAVRKPAGTF